ncbi:hypothetical protein FB565_006449 [Actinoplanes lutulentus]|uniref:BON domain-containing protein n=1 Tax=Actinoplanes lutulentus TaxID=1287878 RepID=A0A327ZA53_9ACTN|nr:BON domain-containing protein [Actinoplanes lutulentus]MBB2946681.1 hypothetical protein [Actinoplanes lutulentus]RAK35574.1 BON domain-containing protein [Actinoplanes lutulentus]
MLHLPRDHDAQLTHKVATRILHEPRLLDERITVQVQNSVVDLAGTVGSLYARLTAADIARSTPGVADVCNRLELARVADVTLDPDVSLDPDVKLDPDIKLDPDMRPPGTRALDMQAPGTRAPDSFDEIIARWDDEPPKSASPAQTFRVGAGVTAGVAVMLWLVVVPEFGLAGLFIVLPFVFVALALARLARSVDTTD